MGSGIGGIFEKSMRPMPAGVRQKQLTPLPFTSLARLITRLVAAALPAV